MSERGMSEFTIRSDAVDVEEIMRQIRARIREKRGVDYTEAEIQELARVKLEQFLDAKAVRSDLVQHFRRERRSAFEFHPPGNYAFEEDTIYASSRGAVGRLIRATRRLLNPMLKLFFNPNPLIHALHRQSEINDYYARALGQYFASREELDTLNYEVLNNLVVELTRLGIEVKNLKMQVESLSSRLDFDERRARALEGVVQYRPSAELTSTGATSAEPAGAGPGTARRRRRRRRRRGAAAPATSPTAATPPGEPAAPGASAAPAEEAPGARPEDPDRTEP